MLEAMVSMIHFKIKGARAGQELNWSCRFPIPTLGGRASLRTCFPFVICELKYWKPCFQFCTGWYHSISNVIGGIPTLILYHTPIEDVFTTARIQQLHRSQSTLCLAMRRVRTDDFVLPMISNRELKEGSSTGWMDQKTSTGSIWRRRQTATWVDVRCRSGFQLGKSGSEGSKQVHGAIPNRRLSDF
jgi:hypothetical protein